MCLEQPRLNVSYAPRAPVSGAGGRGARGAKSGQDARGPEMGACMWLGQTGIAHRFGPDAKGVQSIGHCLDDYLGVVGAGA